VDVKQKKSVVETGMSWEDKVPSGIAKMGFRRPKDDPDVDLSGKRME
jgi:hypothetical protein